MSISETIKNTISQIYVQLQSTIIFKDKFNKLGTLLKEINYEVDESEENKEQYSKINKKLNDLLSIVTDLTDEKRLLLLFVTDEPIERLFGRITEIMKEVVKMMKEMKKEILSPIQEDSYVFNDLDCIDKIIYDAITKLQKKRKEIEELLKQESTEETIKKNAIEVLDEYPRYNLRYSDLNFDENKSFDSNKAFIYYNGKMGDEKVTVMKLLIKSLFKRLLSVLTTIDHPYVEKFIGACIEKNEIYIVTDRHGSHLAEIFESQNDEEILKPGDMTILAFKIAQAMSYLHMRGVIHRNLISYNIFVNRDKNNDEIIPKIVGFRNSRLSLDEDAGYSSLNINSNVPISFFTAPELDDGQYNEKVDVFAFSAILYKMLTNHNPFENKNPFEILNLLSKNGRPTIPEGTEKFLAELIESCWMHEANKRPSFDQILFKMIQNKIVFPFDESNKEKVIRFYENYQIKYNNESNCLELIDSIKYNISLSYHFRFEFLRARPILNSYYSLLAEKYFKNEELTKEENLNIDLLHKNLKDFQDIIIQNSKENWDNRYRILRKIKKSKFKNTQSVIFETYEFIKKITDSLNNIYNSMKNLGFQEIESYKENRDDIIFDYNKLKLDLPNLSYFTEFNMHVEKEKENIEEKWDIDDEVISSKFQIRLEYLFSPFKEYEIDKNELKINGDKIIGEGSYGKVFKCQYKNRTVAVKLMKISPEYEIEMSYLRREVNYLIKLNKHPYIVEFIGYCLYENNFVCLVSKFVEGGSLDDMLYSTNKLSPDDKTIIAFRVAQAMKFIHSHNVIHFDLKPANIMVEGNSPKIIDFGFASPNNLALIPKEEIGSLLFMAPEIYKKDGNYSTAADVYSFGMILWMMHFEEIPEINDDRKRFKERILNNEELPFGQIGNSLKELITSLRNSDPENRPTFKEIVEKMANNHITFPGADHAKMVAFYEKERKLSENFY